CFTTLVTGSNGYLMYALRRTGRIPIKLPMTPCKMRRFQGAIIDGAGRDFCGDAIPNLSSHWNGSSKHVMTAFRSRDEPRVGRRCDHGQRPRTPFFELPTHHIAINCRKGKP